MFQKTVRSKTHETSEVNQLLKVGEKQTEIMIPDVTNYEQTKPRWALLTLNLIKSINFNFNVKFI